MSAYVRAAFIMAALCAYTPAELQINNSGYKAFGYGDIDYVPVMRARRCPKTMTRGRVGEQSRKREKVREREKGDEFT